jgi:hypothetical protein
MKHNCDLCNKDVREVGSVRNIYQGVMACKICCKRVDLYRTFSPKKRMYDIIKDVKHG